MFDFDDVERFLRNTRNRDCFQSSERHRGLICQGRTDARRDATQHDWGHGKLSIQPFRVVSEFLIACVAFGLRTGNMFTPPTYEQGPASRPKLFPLFTSILSLKTCYIICFSHLRGATKSCVELSRHNRQFFLLLFILKLFNFTSSVSVDCNLLTGWSQRTFPGTGPSSGRA